MKASSWIAHDEVKWVNHHEDLFVFEDLACASHLLNIKGYVVTAKSKMVLLMKIWVYWHFYTRCEGIIVNCTWRGKMSQSSWRSVCVWRSCMCQPSIEHQRVRLLISYCYAFFYFCSILKLSAIHGVKPKSCSRSYVHFGVPWILDYFSNDPCTGLPMTLTVAYVRSLAM